MSIHVLNHARDLLLDETPLARNCGTLCGAACCQGDQETGMILFPDEEKLYEGCAFGHILPANYRIGQHRAQIFVCNGSCPREMRPLACRLFPLFLRFENGSPRVRLDPRADMCPLLDFGLNGLRKSFVSAAETAYNCLLADPVQADFLHGLDDAFSL